MASQHHNGGARAPVNVSQQRQHQQHPPPVPKKPSIRERHHPHQQQPQQQTGDVTNGWGSHPQDPQHHHHQNPQKLKSSMLRDDHHQQQPQTITSPWLDRQLHHTQHPQHPQHHHQDEVPRRQELESELDDLKAENQAKSRELDTNRYIEMEMNRKLKIADDAYMLRHLIKDKERQIASQEKIIADLTEDNSRLGEDIADKERTVFKLQSEVDNLDRVIVAKNALKEAERLQAVTEELDRVKDELASIELEVDSAKSELKNLQGQLARRDREVRTKNDQIDNLNKELVEAKGALASLENERAVAESHHRASERESKALKEQVEKLTDYRERCRNLEEENAYVGEAVRALEAKVFHLETHKRDKEALEELVHDLKTALKDKNKVLKDRRDLLIETQQLKEVLHEKSTDEAGLHKELGKLKDVLNELERENDFYRDLEGDFHKIKQRYEELERDKFKHELLAAKLRPKLERLQQRCKEKDDIIRRMANELRGGGDRLPRELLQEADQNQRKTLDDYMDPGDYQHPQHHHHQQQHQLQQDPANSEEPLSEQIVKASTSANRLQDPQKPHQYQPSPKQHYRQASYEPPPPPQSQPQLASPRAAYEPRSTASLHRPQHQQQPPPPESYNQYPSHQHHRSDSAAAAAPRGRHHSGGGGVPPPQQHLEEAVPVRLYPGAREEQLQQAPPPRPITDHRSQPRYQPPEGEEAQRRYYDPHEAAPAPEEPVRQSRAPTGQSQSHPGAIAAPPRQQPARRLLDPPMSLRVSRVLGDGSVMLEWEAPPLDSLDRNNGVVVAGYKVFVNGIEEQTVVSCRLTKCLIARASLGLPASFGVETFGYDGETSERVEIPVAGGGEGRGRSPLRVDVAGGPTSRPQQQQPSQTHQTSPGRLPGLGPQQQQQQQNQQPPHPGVRRRAARDYQPSDESPSAFPSYELELRRGDAVQTFGPVRPDGMFNAEVAGHRGLVPAQYLEIDE